MNTSSWIINSNRKRYHSNGTNSKQLDSNRNRCNTVGMTRGKKNIFKKDCKLFIDFPCYPSGPFLDRLIEHWNFHKHICLYFKCAYLIVFYITEIIYDPPHRFRPTKFLESWDTQLGLPPWLDGTSDSRFSSRIAHMQHILVVYPDDQGMNDWKEGSSIQEGTLLAYNLKVEQRPS